MVIINVSRDTWLTDCMWQDDSYPSVAWKSMVRDGLCCNSTRTNQPFQAMGLDFVLINGILQPTIRAEARSTSPRECTSVTKHVLM